MLGDIELPNTFNLAVMAMPVSVVTSGKAWSTPSTRNLIR